MTSMSADIPWRKTPAQAASVGESPWEANAATIPDRASPIPPEAMYGFPVVLMKTSPFGVAMIVRAPFSVITSYSIHYTKLYEMSPVSATDVIDNIREALQKTLGEPEGEE